MESLLFQFDWDNQPLKGFNNIVHTSHHVVHSLVGSVRHRCLVSLEMTSLVSLEVTQISERL